MDHMNSRFPGFRVWMALMGNFPLAVSVTVLPVYAALMGEMTMPDVLLSDMLAMQGYKGIFVFSMCNCGLSGSFVLYEYFRYCVKKAPHLLPSLSKILVAAILIVNPALYCVIGFDWAEDVKAKDESENEMMLMDLLASYSWAGLINWLVHTTAAGILFVAIGVAAGSWALGVRPHVTQIEHPRDVVSKRVMCEILACSVPIAAVIRAFHMYDRMTWCIPLLIAEQWLLLFSAAIPSVGFLNTMAEMDEIEPIASISSIFRWSNFHPDEVVGLWPATPSSMMMREKLSAEFALNLEPLDLADKTAKLEKMTELKKKTDATSNGEKKKQK